MKTEKLHFKTSSGIKSIVGKDLITDKFVAIFELVKNSYDAGAKEVKIIFEQDKIIIIDDGHGMSKDDLVEKWLNLAYSEKKEGTIGSKERAYVGSKGIGRFSADRLGTNLKITSKKIEECIEHTIFVDWTKFDQDLKIRFEQIEVDYFYEENKDYSSFTKIEIGHLIETWQPDEIEKVKESLRRLKNPFIQDDGFKMLFIDKTGLLEKKEYIKNNIAEIIKGKSITIEAKLSKKIKVELFDRGEKIYEVESDNLSILNSCPISMNINYLTISSKMAFTKAMKIEPVNYGNIFVYKNNFRVMPYGNTDYDLFGLNMRKTQGHSRYLGTRELIGYIEIFDKTNSFFKETSSRNSGFVNNIYLLELQNIFMEYLIRPLEAYMILVSWGEFKIDKNSKETQEVYFDDVSLSEAEKFKKYVSRKTNLIFFKDNLNFEENKPEKKLDRIVEKFSGDEKKEFEPLIKEVKKQVKDLKKISEKNEQIVKEKNKNIEILERQNVNLIRKREESSYGEQLSHHLTTFTDRLDWVVQDLQAISLKLEKEISLELCQSIQTIQRTKGELAIFKDILLKTDFDTRAKFNYDLREVIEWYISEKKNIFRSLKIIVLNSSNFNINCNIIELILMLDNFYNNAYEHGADFIQFDFNDTDNLYISSNSVLISKENFTKVFELGFSTKDNGTGIGLNQIKSFLKKSGFDIHISDNQKLVTFEIYKDTK
ncbi:ATP-binding protein [Acinetobacter bereziniae]|uniref:ATP-binding protein n=1 Tax=Acinetobacter bereziniae TaxID=106648 RepID=UPI00300B7578